MDELIRMALILVLGLVTGFFDSVIGAGGFISVPALIFLGLPPQVAIATDRFGILGQTLAALVKFWKEKKIYWKYVPILSVIALLGSFIGAKILVSIDTSFLETVVAVLILILLPLIFFKKDLGLNRTETSKKKKAIGFVLYFLTMIFGAFFGQGTGPIIFYVLTFFLGFTMIDILAINLIPWLVLSISTLIIFAYQGIIDYKVGLVLLVGMTIGGYIGAHMAIKKGESWIKMLFVALVLVSGIKLLFF